MADHKRLADASSATTASCGLVAILVTATLGIGCNSDPSAGTGDEDTAGDTVEADTEPGRTLDTGDPENSDTEPTTDPDATAETAVDSGADTTADTAADTEPVDTDDVVADVQDGGVDGGDTDPMETGDSGDATDTDTYVPPPCSPIDSEDVVSPVRRISAQVRKDGAVEVAYHNPSNDDLDLASRPHAGSWSTQTIDTGTSKKPNAYPDLILDDAGGLHVSFVSGSTLRYGHRPAGGSWSFSDVETVEDVIYYNSLAVEPTSSGYRAHLAYVTRCRTSCTTHKAEGGHVRYAVGTPGNWSIREFADTDYALGVSVAVDQSGTVHLAYTKDVELKYRRRVQSGGSPTWKGPEVADTRGSKPVDLALDPNGGVHIAYDRYHNLSYASRNSTGSWSREQAFARPSNNPRIRWIDLEIDGTGTPHVIYVYRGDKDPVYYAHKESSWQSEVLNPDGDPWFGHVSLDTLPHGSASMIANEGSDSKFWRRCPQ